jgi:hypothetical protein
MVWKGWKGVTLKLLLVILTMGSTQDYWPKGIETTFQKKKFGNSSGPSIEDVSESEFYPWVQKASGHVYLEFNTNPQHAVSIPRPLGVESHIKHLTLDFYTFRVNENPPPPPPKGEKQKYIGLQKYETSTEMLCFICNTWSMNWPESYCPKKCIKQLRTPHLTCT